MKKTIIIINGKGASGKDTLISKLQDYYKDNSGEGIIINISSIDPIKDIAEDYVNYRRKFLDYNYEFDPEAKDDHYRLFLSELKQAFVHWCNLPFEHIRLATKLFMNTTNDRLLFVHIRESEEIDKYKNYVKSAYNENIIASQLTVRTLLITRDETYLKIYGNESDDKVHTYRYDLRLDNDFHLEDCGKEFYNFLHFHELI